MVVMGVVVVMIVFACRWKTISGETPTTEIPLLAHNAPMTPRPESHSREPGEGFVQEIMFPSNTISGETSTIEMSLLSHNISMMPNPDPYPREPGEVFIEEIFDCDWSFILENPVG